jgi:integrase/recombinase XerD
MLKKGLLVWCNSRGVIFLQDVRPTLLIQWRNTWTFRAKTYSFRVHQGVVKTFFKWCLNSDLIQTNPAERLPKVTVDHDQKQPFSPEEMDKILQAVGSENLQWDDLKRYRVRAVILLMRWSGLACMDAATLERSALDKHDRIICRRNKTGSHVHVRIPKYVADTLRGLPDSEYFFWDGRMQKSSAANRVQDWLRAVFTEAGVKGTSHQFRHTFAVEMLKKGVALEDVSKLLGHKTTGVTEKHYSAWVAARQERLDKVVQAAWD